MPACAPWRVHPLFGSQRGGMREGYAGSWLPLLPLVEPSTGQGKLVYPR
jgi:hypothetical protein